ncbi:Protein of unknown function [Cyclobacterium xiamenense]|uniref:DUF2752 domain-containing protein n=1 Tax=Cyclobacterium xiamenense TaxID=1297121 RepID=A0A1H7BGU5_9BACT|nr:DUF2752 domain-containing protein [Cyclobacterium xiamenense]SEJ76718.1 Protein of unknown function [Cyclobacterium xiamenense]
MKRFPIGILEFLTWAIALTGLFFFARVEGPHAGLCPIANLGLTWCPGCGLGRSIHLFLRGDFHASWEMHPMGSFAVLVIVWRQFELLYLIKKQLKSWQTY